MAAMPIDHRAHIAAEVRAEMARQRKTHDDLAEVLGFTKQAIAKRMAAIQSFRAEELLAVAEWLQVPITQFTSPVRERAAS